MIFHNILGVKVISHKNIPNVRSLHVKHEITHIKFVHLIKLFEIHVFTIFIKIFMIFDLSINLYLFR